MRIYIFLGILLLPAALPAQPVFQPPGTNLTYGDVEHGTGIRAGSGNPAAAAALLSARELRPLSGTAISASAGLEYGNVQEIFDFIDEVSSAFRPSEPGTGGGGPGQNPDVKPPDGIDIGDIIDAIDPDIRANIDAVVRELGNQAAILALISNEGYAKAWLAGDAKVVLGSGFLDGTWTMGINWSGTSTAFGIAEPIQFDVDVALERLGDWIDLPPNLQPPVIPLSDQVIMTVEPITNRVKIILANDSSLVSKSAQATEISFGYSRPAWSNDSGTLYVGAEFNAYLMRLSRLSVRFGDITDSEELFDAINNADFRNDENASFDLGALWVAENYQLGLQWNDINEPDFRFPGVNLEPYTSNAIVDFLVRDQVYTMDSQVKFEGSMFTDDRRWSAHLGIDANSATDPLGDKFQWASLSGGWISENNWFNGARVGYRQNLDGTKLSYLSAGVTVFRFVNFDIASALDTVKIKGDTLPQGLMANIGFNITW